MLTFQPVPSSPPWAHDALNESSIFWAEKWAQTLVLINYVIIKMLLSSSPYYFILPFAASLAARSTSLLFSMRSTCKMLNKF